MVYVNSRAIIERLNGQTLEIVIQTRVKPPEPLRLELPGGRIEPFESLVDALKREVKEETGLTITSIKNLEERIDTIGVNPDFEVECLKPFAAYQTLKGPINSVGFYFRCEATGTLTSRGDDSKNPRWVPVDSLRLLMENDPLQFSDVDRAGIAFYLSQLSLERD